MYYLNQSFNVFLSYTLAETFGEESESILQTAELWKQNISAFIGNHAHDVVILIGQCAQNLIY